MPEIKIGNRLVGDGHPTYIIAEIGVNHNGILALALELIDAAIDTGADVGMISLNKSLANLVKRREISFEQAEFYSLNPTELKTLI